MCGLLQDLNIRPVLSCVGTSGSAGLLEHRFCFPEFELVTEPEEAEVEAEQGDADETQEAPESGAAGGDCTEHICLHRSTQ